MAEDMLPGLPATRGHVLRASASPPEARGRIGAQALALGIGTKADGEVPEPQASAGILQPMPAAPHPRRTAHEVEHIRAMSERAAAIGEISLANLWRRNLALPRSPYFDLAALERMLTRMEASAAGRQGTLPPVAPAVLYGALDEAPAVHQGAAYPSTVLPAPIAAAVVDRFNAALRAIARAGFARRDQVHPGNAPPAVLDLVSRIGGLGGAAVRAINQIGHLRKVSRAGQTAHEPMTLARRLLLVDAALAHLAEDLDVPPWTAAGLGLVTSAVRAAWDAREAAEPTPMPFPRNLFDWADKRAAAAAVLPDPELERLIQQHPDLSYVEALRAERRRRAGGGA